jgi:hypothetical protein
MEETSDMVQMNQYGRTSWPWSVSRNLCLLGLLLTTLNTNRAFAQVDQGTVTGVVQDNSGAVIPGAKMTLTNTDSGLVLHAKADTKGVYVFSPIKIGHYTVSASAPSFETTVQENLKVDLDQKLNITVTLKPGNVSETVTITSAPPYCRIRRRA